MWEALAAYKDKSVASSSSVDASAQKQALVVLGMHRSGTSSLAGALVALGAKGPATALPPAPDNPLGFFESAKVMNLDDRILAAAGSAWDDWRAFNDVWLADGNARELQDEAVATLEQEFGSARLIVVKDPRICRMMPFWTGVFARSGYAILPILPIRSPLEVARSLQRRDGFPVAKGLLLWLRHVLESEVATRQMPRAILDWSDFLADWRLGMARVANQTGVIWPRQTDWSNLEIEKFLTADLRHHVVSADDLALHPEVNEWVRDAFSALIALSSDPGCPNALTALDRVKGEFDKAASVFGGVFADFERELKSSRGDRDALSTQRDELVTQRDALSTQRDELVTQRDALSTQRDELVTQRDELVTQRDALFTQRDELVTQRDALSAQRDDLVSQRDALAREVARLRAKDSRRFVRRIKRFFSRRSV